MTLAGNKRMIVGIFVLFTVNIFWVLSSKLTNYLFGTEKYDKHFLITYLRSSMFSLLLFGFVCSTHWKMLACPQRYCRFICSNIQATNENNEQQSDISILSEPTFVLINCESDDQSRLRHDNDYILVNPGEVEENEQSNETSKRTVTFSRYTEVRHLSETYAEESSMARMSYTATRLLQRQMLIQNIIDRGFYPAIQVMKLAIQFCFFWFIANYARQRGLYTSLSKVANAIITTSSIFTLILAAIFPSSSRDKFNLTKLLIVFLSMSGVVLVSFADSIDNSVTNYEGIIWSLICAIGYAVYLVNLRRTVKKQKQISVPMFLGFVGLWSTIIFWPGFFIFSWTSFEKFQLPSVYQLGSVLVNGVFGTVLPEILWLWGCFLTSSLTATVSMGLAVPLSMATDYFLYNKVYLWFFYLGSIPIIVAFLSIAYLSKRTRLSSDPFGDLLHRIFCSTSFMTKYERLLDPDCESDSNSGNIQSSQGDDAQTKINENQIPADIPKQILFPDMFPSAAQQSTSQSCSFVRPDSNINTLVINSG